MVKKAVALLLALLLVVSAVGCSGSAPETSSSGSSTSESESESEPTSESEPEEEKFVLDVSSFSVTDIGPIDTGNLDLFSGELQSVNFGGDGVFVVKAKITPKSSNKLTISQNYYNVCDLIKSHGFDACSEIQYWAVADMSSGDEAKVVSFTVDSETIKSVADEKIVDNMLGDYVADLFVHQSLK